MKLYRIVSELCRTLLIINFIKQWLISHFFTKAIVILILFTASASHVHAQVPPKPVLVSDAITPQGTPVGGKCPYFIITPNDTIDNVIYDDLIDFSCYLVRPTNITFTCPGAGWVSMAAICTWKCGICSYTDDYPNNSKPTGDRCIDVTYNKSPSNIKYGIGYDGYLVIYVRAYDPSNINDTNSAKFLVKFNPELVPPQLLSAEVNVTEKKVDLKWSKADTTNISGYNAYQDGIPLNPHVSDPTATNHSYSTNGKIHRYNVTATYTTPIPEIVGSTETFTETDSSCTVFSTSMGVNEYTGNVKFSFYPNPANDNITIENSSLNNNKEEMISIYNLQGELLIEQPMLQAKTNINITGLAKGMYFVEVKTEKGVIAKKLLKE